MREFINLELPPCDKREILRYAGVGAHGNEPEILNELIHEIEGISCNKVCFCKLNFTIKGEICDFGDFSVKSKSLSEHLKLCHEAVVFLATAGHGVDRLIAKYSRISPMRAVLFQAIGTERVEALSDAFCAYIASSSQGCPTQRYSPGYGDLPLEVQKDIFRLLAPESSMGVYLSDTLFMTPTKTVTAFIGIK